MINKIGTLEELRKAVKRNHLVAKEIDEITFYVYYQENDGIHDYYLLQENPSDRFIVLFAKATIEDIYFSLTGMTDATSEFQKSDVAVISNDNDDEVK